MSVDPPPLPATTTQYCRVNGPGLDTGDYFGRVSSVTDPNDGVVEQLRPDSFGRQVKELRPGDTHWSMPTDETPYTDATPTAASRGLKVQPDLGEQSGVAGAAQAHLSFYAGLGRLVETLTERTNGDEQVLAYTGYRRRRQRAGVVG